MVGAAASVRATKPRHASSPVAVTRDERALPTDCCSASTVCGAHACVSPSLRKRMRPSSGRLAVALDSTPYAARWRVSTSSASSLKPMPPMGDAVPAKHRSITSAPRPSASNTCDPQYDANVEMPILASTLSSPFSIAVRYCDCACAGSGRSTSPSALPCAASVNSVAIVSSASHGYTASAP